MFSDMVSLDLKSDTVFLNLFGDGVSLDPKSKASEIFHFLDISAVPSTVLSLFATLFH